MGVYLILGVTGVVGAADSAGSLPVYPADSLIKWWDLTSMKPSEFDEYRFGGDPNNGFSKVQNKVGQDVWMIRSQLKGATFQVSLFGGRYVAETMAAAFTEEHFDSLTVMFPETSSGSSRYKELSAEVAALLQKPGDESTSAVFAGKQEKFPQMQWSVSDVVIHVIEAPTKKTVLMIHAPKAGSMPTDASSVSRGKLAAELDLLFRFEEVWKCTAADFEKHYSPKIKEDGIQERPPQFEWLSAVKDRARFTRQMFPNDETRLTLFGGKVKVEEAIVEFVNGRAGRATISIYNRGDAGKISPAEFEIMYKNVGQNLSQLLKVPAKSLLNSSNAALRTMGWSWTTPQGIVFMEFNEYTGKDLNGKPKFPEFLRIKVAAPDQANWSMGKLSVGVGKMVLSRNVTKGSEGDIYIANVPMVDQGAKGYCVAASCQRLFEYFQIPCDQHEMARLVEADAERGVSPETMQKSLARIDGRFNVTFRPIVNPKQFYGSGGKRRISEREFVVEIKDNVEKGTPLLWALQLGRYDEDPPLPGAGQLTGGHMRMIIGYNSLKNQVLFTDSWGAGHELKRMDVMDAYNCTVGLFSMSPRGL